MKDFGGKLAVITGGGTGMGRELARQLIAEGCDVAMCDVSAENMAETVALCEAEAPQGRIVTAHLCDVGDEAQVLRFRDEVTDQHGRDHINLLFNNAGIAGGGSFVKEDRDLWERTFNVCWYGVYNCARAFLPLLIASEEGHIVNTSSVNGFWASLGPMTAHTSYSAAKFAVKGFTEALVNDLRLNAPHVKASVVMPGHIGTSIAINSGKVLGQPSPEEMTTEDIAKTRSLWQSLGVDTESLADDEIRGAIAQRQIDFRDNAPMTAAQAATVIIDGVRTETWRILVGEDAKVLDRLVREIPEQAYEPEFMERLVKEADWGLGS
jgi:NAD(P)-dependent dehydrogenase (short-subunit alcohol dehydrogenase family)